VSTVSQAVPLRISGAGRRRRALIGWAFLTPTLIVFVFFRHLPAIAGLGLGLFDWSVLGTPHFVGLDNYVSLARDPVFWIALKNTTVYTLMVVPVDVAASLVLAYLLNQRLPGLRFFRLAFFIPFLTSTAVVALVWHALYLPDGPINTILAAMHLPTPNWLGEPRTALTAIAVMAIWKHLGFNMLVLLAGLQAIPPELEEAVRIDGAGSLAVFRYVTFPLLQPVLLVVTILTTIDSFQVFDAAYVMTQGGPFYATTTMVFYVFQLAFVQFQMGYAAAVGFELLVIILAVSLLQRWLIRGEIHAY
jgi:multiple sugar transport system permease protein